MTITTQPDDRAATALEPPAELTAAQALAFADSLRERLVEEQVATEERTTYSPELHEELRAAGLYRMLQPKRYGGYELEVPDFLAVVTSLARGCMSSGWC